MIRIKLSPLKIVTFDGEVIELFDGYNANTIRVHVGHIKNIAVATDRKGNHTLDISNNSPVAKLPIEPTQVSKVNELVEAVRKAMSDLAW